MAEGHPPAAAMASYRRSRLPFARPQTLQTLQKPAQLRKEKVPQQAQHAPLLAAGKSHHKATAMAQEHPTAAAMAIRASYRRSRLPFARPQALHTLQKSRLPGLKRSKPSKSPPSSAGTRYPNKPNTRHSRTHKPPQGHSNGWRAAPGRSNGFL